MGENLCKQCDWQVINLQNMQRAHKLKKKKKERETKYTEDLSRYFSKDNIQRAKSTWKCAQHHDLSEKHKSKQQWGILTPIKMAIIKVSTNKKCLRRCEKKRALLQCWWPCKLVKPLCRTVWTFLKILIKELPLKSSNSTSRHISGENHNLKRCMYPMFIEALFTIAKIWKQPKHPFKEESRTQGLWYIHTMELYLTIKKNETMPFEGTWRDLEFIILSKAERGR